MVVVLRGKAGTGKTTLSNMLARELAIPVLRKDDILLALKKTTNLPDPGPIDAACYSTLAHICRTNLTLGASFILDVALADKAVAGGFYSSLSLGPHNAVFFLITCEAEAEWERRHLERLENPDPSQSFSSFSHVQQHYSSMDPSALEHEHVLDNSGSLEQTYARLCQILRSQTG